VAVYVLPISSAFLRTLPLMAVDLGVMLAAGVLLFAAIEVEKWILRQELRKIERIVHQHIDLLRSEWDAFCGNNANAD
jgi:hypothetical protein